MKGYPTVEVSPTGVLIRDRESNVRFFEWSAVDRILAYKLDLIFTDDVCLEFFTADRSYVIEEEAAGWSDLTAQLSDRFTILAGWFEDVVQPPLATNMSVLWNRTTEKAWDYFAGADINELWHVSSADFASDGALRDIYFIETTVEDWNGMLAVARGMFGAVKVNYGGRELKHDLAAKHFAGKKRARRARRRRHQYHGILLQQHRDRIEFRTAAASVLQRPCTVAPVRDRGRVIP